MATKKTLTVSLQVKELMYDIMNKSHLTGVSREAAGAANYEAAAHMQASGDEEHDYQLRRSINNAFAHVKVELGEYLNEVTTTADNKIKEAVDNDGVLTLDFELPSNYNSSSSDSLGNGIHEYIVDKCLADWFEITNKTDAADYLQLAQVALDSTKKALYKRSRPIRPTYTAGA